jgi:hypothetical protein
MFWIFSSSINEETHHQKSFYDSDLINEKVAKWYENIHRSEIIMKEKDFEVADL